MSTKKHFKICRIFFRVFVIVAGAAALTACNGGKNQTNIELIQGMMDQPALKSQSWDSKRHAPEEMVPPAHTIPRGFKPYPYHDDLDMAAKKLINPYAGAKFKSTLVRGKNRFDIYCSPCHGLNAEGDGTVAKYMPIKPVNLLAANIQKLKDGYIYGVITDGYGVMQPYDTQIYKTSDRWAIVNYVRYLQNKAAKSKSTAK